MKTERFGKESHAVVISDQRERTKEEELLVKTKKVFTSARCKKISTQIIFLCYAKISDFSQIIPCRCLKKYDLLQNLTSKSMLPTELKRH